MSTLSKRFSIRRGPVVIVLVIAAIVAYIYFSGQQDQKKVTAYFDQAISVYKGTNVDIMGVAVGSVDSVTPEGGQVKVTISYDAKYKLPADVRAVVITPTLVADRFIQLETGASKQGFFGGGPVLPSGGEIPLYNADGSKRNATPVEMDQIYSSLSDLTTTLGPNGANKDGALNSLLHATATALKGNGALGNQAIANLAQAAQVLGDNSNQIFGTVDSLAGVTTTLQQNDAFVGQFMTHLAGVSSELAGESDNLQQALAAIANAVGTVQAFVHDNKSMLIADIQQLTTTIGVLNQQKDSLGQVLQYSALGLGNLNDAYDNTTGTIGIRAQLGPMGASPGSLLCNVINARKTPLPNANQICALFNALLGGSTNFGAGLPTTSSSASAPQPQGLASLIPPITGLGAK